MANYVLVHGAWGGNQSYELTKRDLEAAGHTVLAATLRGLGTRQAELHPGITLTDHIDDVCQEIAEAGFERFILAGHSYGGMVVTGVAARLGDRIDSICYIDAFLPGDGESLWDITGGFEHAWYIDTQKFTPGLIRPLGTPEDFQPVPQVVGYHPLLTLLEAVRYTGKESLIPRRAYIFATGYEQTPFPRFAEQARAEGWDYHETDCDHFVMQNRPEKTAEVLLGLAE
jgi:pimeloyl-ACP methyl ester carboxylesterase